MLSLSSELAIAGEILQVNTGYILSQILNGVVQGMIYILIALGLSIIFGLMGVVNFAHGEFLLVGVYVGLAVTKLTGIFLIGLVAAPIIVAMLGAGIERFTLRPIYDRDIFLQILVTFGMAEIIREMVQIIWGRTGLAFPVPNWGTGMINLILFEYPTYRLTVIIIAALILLGVFFMFTYTDLGLIIRAATADREMVNALGIDVTNMYLIVFMLGAGIAGMAGVLIGPLRNARPLLGLDLLIPSFVVVVVGGLGSLRGSVVAGLLIGEVVVLTGIFSSAFSEVIIYIVMAVVLLTRPRGLFGREVEL